MTPSLLDRWARGWRGPLLAALATLAAVLPGLMRLPATDRAEARLAEASARMLEERDFAAPSAADEAPGRRPYGVHWLQAGAAALVPGPEPRRIWALRLPAAAGAMIAAAACAWGGAALFGPTAGLAAGVVLGAGALVSTAGTIDAPGALLGGGVTLAMAALVRLRLAWEGAFKAGAATRALFWLGLALAAAAGGPTGPAVVLLSGLCLWLAERRAAWIGGLGWGWGLILLAALVGPIWMAGAVQAGPWTPLSWPDLGQGTRSPGFQLLIAPLLAFPFALLLPAGLAKIRAARRDVSVRLALCWLAPAWIVLEFVRGQDPGRGLLVYGALAWLCAAAARDGVGRLAARAGAGLQVAAAVLYVLALVYLAQRFGGGRALLWAAAAAVLAAGAGLAGAGLLLRGRPGAALLAAAVLGIAAHGAALGGLAPALDELWPARAAAAALAAAGLDPRGGVTPGPVAVSGFEEPSLAFALGGQMEASTPEAAAEAVRTGRPAIVEARQEDAFLAALPSRRLTRRVAEVEGYDYAAGSSVRLSIYGPVEEGP